MKMNTPNKITLVRMVLVFVIAILLLLPVQQTILFNEISVLYFVAFILFLIASFSDFLDGYLARKNNQITTFGKFMDPIADKLLIDTCFIILTVYGPCRIPVLVTILMISRDLVVDAVKLVAASKNKVVAANIWGKLKTVVQMIALSLVFLNNWPFIYFDADKIITTVVLYLAGGLSLLSMIIYIIQNRKVFKDE